jgi:hypothetical protein
MPLPEYMVMLDQDGGPFTLVNMSLVRTAQFVEGELRLAFSEQHTIHVRGSGALEFLLVLLEHAYLPGGAPAAELSAAVRSQLKGSAEPSTQAPAPKAPQP